MLINSLEKKFGRFAIPGILKILATFQALVFLLTLMRGSEIDEFLSHLLILGEKGSPLATGEFWRFFSFLLLPGDDVISVLFTVLFAFFISDALEQAWGVFRVNLYLISHWLILCLAACFNQMSLPYLIFANMTMAFAAVFPGFTIRLYGIVPIQARWIGILTVGTLLWTISANPFLRWSTALTVAHFLICFGPRLLRNQRHLADASRRRKVFQENAPELASEFHCCKTCGRTDAKHPELEFRIAPDGNEYCGEHLP